MIRAFINFDGRCNEAICFYESVFEVKNKRVMYLKDTPSDLSETIANVTENFVVHAAMDICGTEVWLGDTPNGITPGDMVTLGVGFATVEEVEETFNKLKEGGEVFMELAPQFYSKMFGCVQDKFGVIWHIICE